MRTRSVPASAYQEYVQAPSAGSTVPQPTTLIPSGWPPFSVLGAVLVSPSYWYLIAHGDAHLSNEACNCAMIAALSLASDCGALA